MSNVSYTFRGVDRYALKYFQWMQMRIASGYCGTDMTNDRDGYAKFCSEIGPIPPDMTRPSVGRIDHSKGYVAGNFNWQEHIENCRDNDKQKISAVSKVTARRMWNDPQMRERLLAKLRDPERRKKQSEMMKGNRFARMENRK